MADRRLLELPLIGVVTTGTSIYTVYGGQSYQSYVDQMANVIMNNYGVLTINLPAGLMTAANAELILEGLNNASSAQLDWDRIDTTLAFFDIDGGVFSDTYVNTSTFDGGPIV